MALPPYTFRTGSVVRPTLWGALGLSIETAILRRLVAGHRQFSLLDSRLASLEWPNPRSSGLRPIHVPIPPNVPPIGTRTFRWRFQLGSRQQFSLIHSRCAV